MKFIRSTISQSGNYTMYYCDEGKVIRVYEITKADIEAFKMSNNDVEKKAIVDKYQKLDMLQNCI
jgi:hypothetical protein